MLDLVSLKKNAVCFHCMFKTETNKQKAVLFMFTVFTAVHIFLPNIFAIKADS